MPIPLGHADAIHFMVARTDRMGDVILTGPLFDAIKQHFPRARLSVLASSANAQIARLHPAVDAVEVDTVEARASGWSGTLVLARHLRRLQVDVILFANSKHRLALAAWLARIPVRIGAARRGYSFLYTFRVAAADAGHETDRVLTLLEPFGIHAPATEPNWRVAENDRHSVRTQLTAAGVKAGSRLAAVHPSNSGNALTGSPEWYAALGDALVAAGYVVLLTGTEQDRPLTAAIGSRMRIQPIDLTGRLSVPELAALYACCAVCIGSSTGPTHLAAAVGAATIGLYAPLVTQARWLPRGTAVAILQPEVGMSCARCFGTRCRFFNCMDRIAPERVVRAAARASDLTGPVKGE